MARKLPILFYHSANGSFVAFTSVSAFLYGNRRIRLTALPSAERNRRPRIGGRMGRRHPLVRRQSDIQMKPVRPGLPLGADFGGVLRRLSMIGGTGGRVEDRIRSRFRSRRAVRFVDADVPPVRPVSFGRRRRLATNASRSRRRVRIFPFLGEAVPFLRPDPEPVEAVRGFARNTRREFEWKMEGAPGRLVGLVPRGRNFRVGRSGIQGIRRTRIRHRENTIGFDRTDGLFQNQGRGSRIAGYLKVPGRRAFPVSGLVGAFRFVRKIRRGRGGPKDRRRRASGLPLPGILPVFREFRQRPRLPVVLNALGRRSRRELDPRNVAGVQGFVPICPPRFPEQGFFVALIRNPKAHAVPNRALLRRCA